MGKMPGADYVIVRPKNIIARGGISPTILSADFYQGVVTLDGFIALTILMPEGTTEWTVVLKCAGCPGYVKGGVGERGTFYVHPGTWSVKREHFQNGSEITVEVEKNEVFVDFR